MQQSSTVLGWFKHSSIVHISVLLFMVMSLMRGLEYMQRSFVPCRLDINDPRLSPDVQFEGREQIEQLFQTLVNAAGKDLPIQPTLIIHSGSTVGRAQICTDGVVAMSVTLIESSESEAKLAGIMAHELGHFASRHHRFASWIMLYVSNYADDDLVGLGVFERTIFDAQMQAEYFALTLLERTGYSRNAWLRHIQIRLANSVEPTAEESIKEINKHYQDLGGSIGTLHRIWEPWEHPKIQKAAEEVRKASNEETGTP